MLTTPVLEIEKVTVDFETQSRAPLKKCGAYEYSMESSTRASCMAMKSDKHQKVWFLNYHQLEKKFDDLPLAFRILWIDWLENPVVVLTAHNAFFEQCIYNNVLVKRFGWPPIPIRKWRCTAAKAAAVAIPRSLEYAGAVMKTAIQKDYEGHRVMMKLCKPTGDHSRWQKEIERAKKLAQKKNRPFQEYLDLRHLENEPPEFWTPDTAPEDYTIQDRYCIIDVKSEELLDQSLPDLLPHEQSLWFVDQLINLRGVNVDIPLVNQIAECMKKESWFLENELDALTLGLVSSGNARNAILEFMRIEGIDMPDLKAKTVDEFLTNGKVTGDAKKLLKIRKALSKASTAKYKKFQGVCQSDGRARDLFLFNAASTLRWGGKNIQPQNFPRGTIKDIFLAIDEIKTRDLNDTDQLNELKLLYGENLMPLFSSILRGMFVPTKGHELFIEDLNAIECRVLWYLAGHEKGLKLFREGLDPYRQMAAIIFNKRIEDVTDEERQVGKAAVLGCGYQMGFKKFITSAFDVYGARVTKEIAQVSVAAYRDLHFPVVELWENYQQASIAAIENPGKRYKVGPIRFQVKDSFLWITMPSGTPIAYKDPTVVWGKTLVMVKNKDDIIYASNTAMYEDAKAKGYRRESTFTSKRIKYWAVNQKAKKADCVIPKWTQETTYGGKIAENIVQSVSRCVLAEKIVLAERLGFKVVMHSHDELVSEAPIGKKRLAIDSKGMKYCPEYRALMEDPPSWAKGLPLKSGGWVGNRYRKG